MGITLRIVTPAREMFNGEVDMAVLRGQDGDFGVLPGHSPFATMLGYGGLRFIVGGEEREASVLGGFAEVTPNSVTVLSDAAEWPEEIDVHRAEEAKIRAERIIHEANSKIEVRRAQFALRRALVRIEVSTYPLIKGRINKD